MSFFRLILILLVAIVLISILRGVIGIVAKALAGLSEPRPARRRPAANPPEKEELKRDPVCGVYVPVASSVKRTVGGEVVHFCSEDCSRRYRATG